MGVNLIPHSRCFHPSATAFSISPSIVQLLSKKNCIYMQVNIVSETYPARRNSQTPYPRCFTPSTFLTFTPFSAKETNCTYIDAL